MSRLSSAVAVLAIAALPAGAQAKKLAAPVMRAPADGATVEVFPAFTWNAVKHADRYQVQVAADSRFTSPLGIFGARSATLTTTSTAATASKSASDGMYHWRVRALRPNGDAGRWSQARTLTKAWTTPPALLGADALNVVWPSQPLELAWTAVPHAVKYQVQIATDPGMTNLVVGGKTKPYDIFGTTTAFPSSLPSGRYFWTVTPVDAEGFKGQTSAVRQFNWSWPTATTLSINDLDPDPRRFDPQFSWSPIPGAARYEVEVNADQSFAPNSKWCCSDKVTGTSLSPKQLLANNNYYARVRGIDVDGNAGQWNVFSGGATFTNAFDDVTPSIPNLRLGDTTVQDIGAGAVTQTPVVRWDPVAGAHEYEVETAPFNGTSCDYSAHGHSVRTATTSWTPLGSGTVSGFSSQTDALDPDAPGSGSPVSYCLQVRALTDNDSLTNKLQASPWTELMDNNGVAFQFQAPADPGPTLADTAANDYLTPQPGGSNAQTPLFTWNAVPGARSYFVVIARDPNFTNIADAAITEIPAYAPRQRSLSASQAEPLTDETTSYYWVVFPSAGSNASGINTSRYQANNYRTFNKSSVPPTPLGPQTGSDVSTQPTFRWSDAQGARDYRLQVGTDPTFSNLLEDVTTDSSAYTSTLTYPADTTLYWRVRGNDTNGRGLNWSATATFTRRLPVPSFQAGNPTSGIGLPVFAWDAVDGAVGYDIHADNGDGSTADISTESTAFSPKEIWGTGLFRYKVRAVFPSSSGGKVGGPYTALQPFTRSFGPVAHVNALRSKSRMLLSWDGYAGAKSYQAAISTTDSFDHTIASVRTDGTVWAPDLRNSPGGRLYYRVAPIDTRGGAGAEAVGSFTLPKSIRVSVAGLLLHEHASRITITAKDGRGRPVKRGRTTITGAGMATKRLRLDKRGQRTVTLRPRKRGAVTILVRLKGYVDGTAVRRVS